MTGMGAQFRNDNLCHPGRSAKRAEPATVFAGVVRMSRWRGYSRARRAQGRALRVAAERPALRAPVRGWGWVLGRDGRMAPRVEPKDVAQAAKGWPVRAMALR